MLRFNRLVVEEGRAQHAQALEHAEVTDGPAQIEEEKGLQLALDVRVAQVGPEGVGHILVGVGKEAGGPQQRVVEITVQGFQTSGGARLDLVLAQLAAVVSRVQRRALVLLSAGQFAKAAGPEAVRTQTGLGTELRDKDLEVAEHRPDIARRCKECQLHGSR